MKPYATPLLKLNFDCQCWCSREDWKKGRSAMIELEAMQEALAERNAEVERLQEQLRDERASALLSPDQARVEASLLRQLYHSALAESREQRDRAERLREIVNSIGHALGEPECIYETDPPDYDLMAMWAGRIETEREHLMQRLKKVEATVDKLPKCRRLNERGESVRDVPVVPGMELWFWADTNMIACDRALQFSGSDTALAVLMAYRWVSLDRCYDTREAAEAGAMEASKNEAMKG